MAISAYVPLDPGDLIATGTPAGVGIGFKPPRYLKPGDVVKISITGIGELTIRWSSPPTPCTALRNSKLPRPLAKDQCAR